MAEKINVTFILTNNPDPRLYRRIRTFTKYGFSVNLIFAERAKTSNPVNKNDFVNVFKIKYRDTSRLIYRIKDILAFSKKASKLINKHKPSIIYIDGFDVLVANYFGNWHDKAPIIYEVSDLPGGRWRKSLFFRWLIDTLEKRFIQYVDKIVLTSPYFNRGNYDGYEERVFILENLPEKRIFAHFSKSQHKNFVVGYFGIVRHKKSLENLIRALGNLKGIEVLIAGFGVGDIYEDIIKIGQKYGNIKFVGSYNYERDIINLYSAVDCVYSVYDYDDENTSLALGNKLYEAVVCSLPLLVTKGSKMGDFVEFNRLGFAVHSDNIDDIRRVVMELSENKDIIKQIENRCREICHKYFYEYTEEKFLRNIEQLMKKKL
jgi:glycosyltransferase involved in cell wall biosynthesis